MDHEIDLYDVFRLLKKKSISIFTISLICSIIAACYSFVFLSNEYTADVSMYILMKEDSTTNRPTYSDINASQMLVNDISDLAFTERVQSETSRTLNLDSLGGYSINVRGQDDSRVLTLTVTGEDPALSSSIANTLVNNISLVAEEVMDVESVNIIDEAETPDIPSGPNRPKNIILAFILGSVLSSSYFVLRSILNRKISTFNRIEGCIALPVVGKVPSFDV